MSVQSKTSWAALAIGAALAMPAVAELSAADLAKLGTTLTPIGAEKAGNAAGTIPAWDGGVTRVQAGYKPGGAYPDPFAADPRGTSDRPRARRSVHGNVPTDAPAPAPRAQDRPTG